MTLARLAAATAVLTFVCSVTACDSASTATTESAAADLTPPAATDPPATTTSAEPASTTTAAPPSVAGVYGQDALIADARQLAAIIESAHPDPYGRGGGKVAFHLRLDALLSAIPDDGMTRDEFIGLLRPFIAAIGDSHTEIWSDYEVDAGTPGGVPIRFGIVEQSLYVAGVLDETYRPLIGAVLVAVEGVPVAELINRQRDLVPLENEYHVLEELASHTLWYQPYLAEVLPEWDDPSRVTVSLQLPSGRLEDIAFDLPVTVGPIRRPDTAIDLPSTGSHGFAYTMMDAGAVAYLRVDHMQLFREESETRGANGAGIVSVTETFRELVIDMSEAGTEALIVDLRDNGGGHSLMADILIYYLYGKEALIGVKHDTMRAGGQVDRYSQQAFTPPNQIGVTLEELNEDRAVPIELGGYDFSAFFSGDEEDFEQYVAEMAEETFVDWFRGSPTFFAEYESEDYSGFYLPEDVVVLVSPWTFSSGLTMTRDLYRVGATLVGTPSAQASNSFGNGLMWHLDHTGLEGGVTRSYFVVFPEESGLGQVLPVDQEMTYDRLAGYGFDPNATFLYALELLGRSAG